MTIGLPRALLFYKYQYLWTTFFETLGFQVIVSEDTNKKILEDGIRFSIDECCLPAKIYMGHVYSLIGQCDYILTPRVENFGRQEIVCVKLNAMYDIVRNVFKNAPLIDYNINVTNGENERDGFLQIGKRLGKSYAQSLRAYRKAKREQLFQDGLAAQAQIDALYTPDALKILLVAHPYNVYDKLLGHTIIQQIEQFDGVVIFADAADHQACNRRAEEISNHLYWTFNRELVGAINLFQEEVDGIVLMTAFPCGPDSLVNELVLRKMKKVPIVNIVLDELQGETGLQTRIESFMDIIKEKKKVGLRSHG